VHHVGNFVWLLKHISKSNYS